MINNSHAKLMKTGESKGVDSRWATFPDFRQFIGGGMCELGGISNLPRKSVAFPDFRQLTDSALNRESREIRLRL